MHVHPSVSLSVRTHISPPPAQTASSIGPVHHWRPSCKGNKRRIKCLPSDELLISPLVSVSVFSGLPKWWLQLSVRELTLFCPLQRDLRATGELCPSLHKGQVFVMGEGRGLLGFGDGASYRYIFRSLRRAFVYRLHLRLAPGPVSGVSERGGFVQEGRGMWEWSGRKSMREGREEPSGRRGNGGVLCEFVTCNAVFHRILWQFWFESTVS